MRFARVGRAVLAVALAAPWLAAASADQSTPRSTGWADLSRVVPGTAIVVHLTDGRRLERHMVATTDDELRTLDLSGVSSRERRQELLALVRQAPDRYTTPTFVDDNGERLQIVQRFDRAAIVMVSRPRSVVFKVATPVDWLLHSSGPCPNCDTAQTVLAGETPLPSPLPRKAGGDPRFGEVLYRAPAPPANPLDAVAWPQLRLLLPPSLAGK